MINRTNTVLAVLLVVVVAMITLVDVDYSRPNIEILPDMKYTPAWEAFAANPIFPDGRTMQPPVPGTIARGPLPLYYAATKEDAVRAGEELANPHSLSAIEAAVVAERDAAEVGASAAEEAQSPSDARPAADAAQQNETALRSAIVRDRFSASLERGGEVYRRYCISCHGPKGAGDGLVTQRGFPPPPSMLTGKSRQMKDGQLFHILTYGQGSMAPFAAQLSRELRWDVINYVRDLQSKAPPTDAPATPLEEKEVAAEDTTDLETGAKAEETSPKLPRNELRDSADGDSDSSSPRS
jgi:mono/diheme cytochrome c family protein